MLGRYAGPIAALRRRRAAVEAHDDAG